MTNGEIERNKFPANLQPQSYPDAINEFLRCQLGKYVSEQRTMKVRYEHGVEEHTFGVRLFHLLGYGSTWEQATQMALVKLGLASPAPESSADPFVAGQQFAELILGKT